MILSLVLFHILPKAFGFLDSEELARHLYDVVGVSLQNWFVLSPLR